MKKSNSKKRDQLGMPIGTASGRLRKQIVFHLLKRLNENICYQCNNEILSADEISIEHKEPYLDSYDPVKLFFDLDNIGFSHLSCNVAAARKTIPMSHPSHWAYHQGCRCGECREIERLRRQEQRLRGIKT